MRRGGGTCSILDAAVDRRVLCRTAIAERVLCRTAIAEIESEKFPPYATAVIVYSC